jgi:hypothetical protein
MLITYNIINHLSKRGRLIIKKKRRENAPYLFALISERKDAKLIYFSSQQRIQKTLLLPQKASSYQIASEKPKVTIFVSHFM